jgi:hypothetical protein
MPGEDENSEKGEGIIGTHEMVSVQKRAFH